MIPVNECYTNIIGDGLRNLRCSYTRQSDGSTVMHGWAIADSVEGLRADPPLCPLPVWMIIPGGLGAFESKPINNVIFARMQKDQDLWGLDFRPPAPAPVQNVAPESILGLLAATALLGIGAALSSRN